MIPTNYALGGQPGIPQPQPQPGPQQGMPNMGLNQAQFWQMQQHHQQQQHAQQQQQQLMAAMRSQGGQQQMLEYLRARGNLPTQQQGMQQQQRQQMSFGGMSLGANGPPSFPHDPSQASQNAQQYGNAPSGQGFPNNLQLQALAARNQNAMSPNQGGDSMRQLNLILAQQNQHNQNGGPQNAMAAFPRLQQSQPPQHLQPPQQSLQQHSQSMGGGGHLPPGLFGGPMNANMPTNLSGSFPQANGMGQVRPTGMMPQHGMQDAQTQAQQPRRMTLKEMQDRAQVLNTSISHGEMRIKLLQAQHGDGPIPPDHLAEISKTQKEVELRRQALGKIMQVVQNFQQSVANGVAPNGLTLPMNMNGPSASPVPHPRMANGSTNPSQTAWMPQPGPSSSPAHQFNSPRPPMAGVNMMQNGAPQQNVPQMSTPQLPPNMVASHPNQMVPRSANTPLPVGAHQQGAAQPSHAQNMMGNNGMRMGNGQQQAPPVPFASFPLTPLPRQQFHRAYFEQWTPKHGAKNNSILKFEGREIDLYQLHYEVISAGSHRMVNQKDLWPVIGAKLGFVNFPGTNTEPGRAGPALAAQLELIYKEFLLDFDQQYLKQLIQHRRAQQLKMNQAGPMDNNGPQQQMQSNGAPMPQSLADIKDPKLISELVSYSAYSVQDLQQRGVPPQIIQIVETNRDRLKATLETQRNFRLSVANAASGGPGQQRNVSNPMANAPQSLNTSQMTGQDGPKPNMPIQSQPPQQMATGMQQMQQQNGQPSQQMGANGQMMPGQPPRPTAVQMQNAIETVKRLRDECKGIGLPPRQVHISDAQRIDYNVAFENLHRMISEVDSKLPHFAVFMNKEVIRKLVLMINAVQQQRELLAGQGPPKYIMPLELVRTMINQVISANTTFKNWLTNAMRQNGAAAPPQQNQMPSNQQQPRPPLPAAASHPPAIQPPSHLPVTTASSPAPLPPHTPSAAAASPPMVIGTPIMKKPTPKPTDTPAATPSHTVASPQTPRSPKPKAVPKKGVPRPRRASKISSAANAASPSAGPSETKPPATPATPVNAPTPDSSAGTKRPREEEPASAAPAAKKIKTEWDEPPSNALEKRQAEADAVKTDEDAVKFFEQMTNWLSQVTNASEGEGQDGFKEEIATELNEILKAYPVNTDDSGFSIGSSSPRLNAAMVDPADFFDFTSYGLPEEETGSKAATPDLVQGTPSVGPSPGSASETEAHRPASTAADTAKIVEPKTEPSDGVDSIPQELWRAIDGGESAFYNASDNWKWDQPMPSVEQPWAFYSPAPAQSSS